jgi:hypothetical protein
VRIHDGHSFRYVSSTATPSVDAILKSVRGLSDVVQANENRKS